MGVSIVALPPEAEEQEAEQLGALAATGDAESRTLQLRAPTEEDAKEWVLSIAGALEARCRLGEARRAWVLLGARWRAAREQARQELRDLLQRRRASQQSDDAAGEHIEEARAGTEPVAVALPIDGSGSGSRSGSRSGSGSGVRSPGEAVTESLGGLQPAEASHEGTENKVALPPAPRGRPPSPAAQPPAGITRVAGTDNRVTASALTDATSPLQLGGAAAARKTGTGTGTSRGRGRSPARHQREGDGTASAAASSHSPPRKGPTPPTSAPGTPKARARAGAAAKARAAPGVSLGVDALTARANAFQGTSAPTPQGQQKALAGGGARGFDFSSGSVAAASVGEGGSKGMVPHWAEGGNTTVSASARDTGGRQKLELGAAPTAVVRAAAKLRSLTSLAKQESRAGKFGCTALQLLESYVRFGMGTRALDFLQSLLKGAHAQAAVREASASVGYASSDGSSTGGTKTAASGYGAAHRRGGSAATGSSPLMPCLQPGLWASAALALGRSGQVGRAVEVLRRGLESIGYETPLHRYGPPSKAMPTSTMMPAAAAGSSSRKAAAALVLRAAASRVFGRYGLVRPVSRCLVLARDTARAGLRLFPGGSAEGSGIQTGFLRVPSAIADAAIEAACRSGGWRVGEAVAATILRDAVRARDALLRNPDDLTLRAEARSCPPPSSHGIARLMEAYGTAGRLGAAARVADELLAAAGAQAVAVAGAAHRGTSLVLDPDATPVVSCCPPMVHCLAEPLRREAEAARLAAERRVRREGG